MGAKAPVIQGDEMNKEDVYTLALAIKRANNHDEPEEFARNVVREFEALNPEDKKAEESEDDKKSSTHQNQNTHR